jgi:hypothetical protein
LNGQRRCRPQKIAFDRHAVQLILNGIFIYGLSRVRERYMAIVLPFA